MQKYALPDLIDEVSNIIYGPESIIAIEKHIPHLREYVRKNYITVNHEPEEIVIAACYDYLINEIRGRKYVFSMDLLDAIQKIVEKSDTINNAKDTRELAHLRILEEYKLVKYYNSKAYPNLACQNIYNIYLYQKDKTGTYKRKTERLSGPELSLLLRCRVLYEYPLNNKEIIATILRLERINMVKPVVLDGFSKHNALYIMTPLAQSYLRTTRKTTNYNISAFVYPVINKQT